MSVEGIFSGPWDITRIVQTMGPAVGILVGAYTLWRTLKFAETFLFRRLKGYILREDKRITDIQSRFGDLMRDPKLIIKQSLPVYSYPQLEWAAKQLGRGKADRAAANLEQILERREQRLRVIRHAEELQERQAETTHFLLGVIAANKKQHEKALSHFKNVIDTSPEHLDALEFSAQQLIDLQNPKAALEMLNRLVECIDAKVEPNTSRRARAYFLRAAACKADGNHRNANLAMIAAIEQLPAASPPLISARYHEFHGDIRAEQGYDNAEASYSAALQRFSLVMVQSGPDKVEGQKGVTRVSEKLAAIGAPAHDGATLCATCPHREPVKSVKA
jgi:tetratricopeptide (TPR) repeat protein